MDFSFFSSQFFSIPSTDVCLLSGTATVLVILCLLLQKRLYSFVRRRQKEALPTESTEHPPLSVVIVCRDQAGLLERNLPLLLGQEYPRFEVIVVMDNCTDETEHVLTLLEKEYPHLHHTFIPDTARYVSHQKLGITLGIKSARYEWIVLTRPDCTPAGPHWLQTLASHFDAGTDIVLGYANYKDDHTQHTRFLIYNRMKEELKWMLSARKKATGGDGCNLALRRSLFLEKRGYAGRLNLLCGSDDLLVDKLSSDGRTRVCCKKEAFVRQTRETSLPLENRDRLLRMVARKHLSHKSKLRQQGPWLLLHCLQGVCRILLLVFIFFFAATKDGTAVLLSSILFLGLMTGDFFLFREMARRLEAPIRFVWFYEWASFCSWPVRKMQCFLHRHDFYRDSESQY